MGYYYDEREARDPRERRQAWEDDDWQPESERERWQAQRRRQQMTPGQTSYGGPARPARDFNEQYGAGRYPDHPRDARYGSDLRYGLNGGYGWERAGEWRDPQAWERDDEYAEQQWRQSAERAREPREHYRGRERGRESYEPRGSSRDEGRERYFSDLRSDRRYWTDPDDDEEQEHRYMVQSHSPGYRQYAQRRGWETDEDRDEDRDGDREHGMLYNLGRRIGEVVGDWFGTPDEREQRAGPRGYQRSDERIRDQICERLSYARGVDVSDVSVEVNDGVVSLTGTVRDRGQKYYIEDMADGTYGVKDVNNDIRVRRDSERPGQSSSSGAGSAGSTTGTTGTAGTTGASSTTGSSASSATTGSTWRA
ncbi:BON domain-containing protein [Cupriavidus taiwanensis]|uniref:BON domain-containing protein n=1 Tax=Cupriavidus taiwanensis TaxID=164546 RepID=UPI001571751B|nr:BON domain-containing protein [Cupriavidus taiwanensis]NSX14286.1 BON domain-containing protein [Cupriavidus taiwanensis]